MKPAEGVTPVAAIVAALSTMACCLPLSFLGAAGIAGLGLWMQAFRPWFVAAAILLLILGFFQLYRRRAQCQRRSPVSVALFWVAAAIVLVVILFPQAIANLMAG
jgi:uncharacterized membrane protein YidH (DUF202 family)